MVKYKILREDTTQECMTKYLGIDIGLQNLVTLATNFYDINPRQVSGGDILKFAQMTDTVIRQLPKSEDDHYATELLSNFHTIRDDYFHGVADAIIAFCDYHEINSVFIGEFTSQIRDKIKYFDKVATVDLHRLYAILFEDLKSNGFNVTSVDEFNTTKSSFVLNEGFGKKVSTKGYRNAKTNMHVTPTPGKGSGWFEIDADVNAALNIIRKGGGDGLFGLRPRRDFGKIPVLTLDVEKIKIVKDGEIYNFESTGPLLAEYTLTV